MGKLSNIKLLGILGGLILIYVLFEVFGGKNRSDNFRSELVNYQNDKVDRIVITKEGKSMELRKNGSLWTLKTEKGIEVEAVASKVDNAIAMLKEAKPSRIAARKEEKWKDYNVDDSTGVRVEFFAESKKVADVVLGRFAPTQRGGTFAFSSFVRLYDEKEVYVCEDFMAMSFPNKSSDFRETTVLKFNRDSIFEISFAFPADSSFLIKKGDDGKWTIDGKEVNSDAFSNFLSDINYTMSTDFEDGLSKTGLGKETYALIVKEKGTLEPITISAFPNPEKKWLITSSMNSNAIFSDSEEKIIKKMFSKGKKHFLPAETTATNAKKSK